jgi:hypothetical protein
VPEETLEVGGREQACETCSSKDLAKVWGILKIHVFSFSPFSLSPGFNCSRPARESQKKRFMQNGREDEKNGHMLAA